MGEDITATRSFCNMKISILIASLALIYATASPIDNVVPEESLIDYEYIHPDDEAHATAQRKVNELLQSGKSDADCRKLAKSTADDVIKSVAAQQAALNKMGRGSQCNVEGSSLIAAAVKSESAAESNLKSKRTAYENAKAKKFNFGDFSYNTLTEGQCGSVEVGQSICGSCQECHGQSSRGSGPSKERLGGCEGNCSEDGGNMQMQRQKAACEDHH